MGIKITAEDMTCATSGHSAHHDDAGAWSVSYLPGRTFTRTEAITALSLAEAAVTIDKAAATETGGATWDRLWPHICGWADELGVSPTAAFGAAVQSPEEDNVEDATGGPQAGVWTVNADEGTAVGPTVPVAGDGTVFATLTALWDDEAGVRVSIDWQASPDDMSAEQALALADALRSLAAIDGPEA